MRRRYLFFSLLEILQHAVKLFVFFDFCRQCDDDDYCKRPPYIVIYYYFYYVFLVNNSNRGTIYRGISKLVEEMLRFANIVF